MKKALIVFPSLLLFLFSLSCDDSVSPEMQNRFALYLLINNTLTTKDVEDLSISKLLLRPEPLLTYEDIVAYDFENHKVYLNNNLSIYLGKDSIRVFSNIWGIPFILIANGNRIYLGSFVTGLSSWTPNTPKIVDYAVNNTEKSFVISRAPYYDKSSFVDVRNDERIFQALREKIIK